jgi:2-dehydro-3-deoxygalactonokinase
VIPYRIYGDWGTTRLRLWRIEEGAATAFGQGPGIGQLDGAPADVLRRAIEPWRAAQPPERLALCGMVGARNGLHEVAYAACPAAAADWRRAAADLSFDGLPLRIAAGAACRDEEGRADVMRGEETQVFGAIRLEGALASGRHLAVLPGTHSKWVTIEDGRITDIRTFLTGELFALLQGSSLLAAGGESGTDDAEAGFAAGLDRAATSGGLLGSLFEARAAQLRDGRSAGWARSFLSGLLLGSELAELRRAGQLPREVAVVGGAELAARYTRTLASWDIAATPLDGDACALAGLELLDADD